MSSNRNSSVNWDDLTFDGTDCVDFIRSVKILARDSGMPRENDRIADMISPSFVGDALVWFTQLDPDVTGDRALLQRAILDKYYDSSKGGSSKSSALIPSPAAAPPLATVGLPPPPPAIGASGPSYPLPSPPRSGRLKLLDGGRHTGEYVSRFTYLQGRAVCATSVLEDAVIVGLPSSEQHVLEILNPNPNLLWLGSAVIERDLSPSLKLVTSLFAEADAKIKPHRSTISPSNLAQACVWDISRLDSSLRLTWELDGNTYTLGAVQSQSTNKMFFASNPAAFMQHYASEATWRRVEIVFEPTP